MKRSAQQYYKKKIVHIMYNPPIVLGYVHVYAGVYLCLFLPLEVEYKILLCAATFSSSPAEIDS